MGFRARILSLIFLLAGLSARAAESPSRTLERLLEVINRHQEISEIVSALRATGDLRQGLPIGAVLSASLQTSDRDDNPRLLLRAPWGTLAFLLEGDSLEFSVEGQRATVDLPVRHPKGIGVRSSELGELLFHFHPFPRGSRPFSAMGAANRLKPPFSDTKRCTGCHVDVVTTKGPYGQLPLQVGGERFLALVSPDSTGETPIRAFRVPQDLVTLRDRACRRERTLGDEACRRLQVVLELEPIPEPRYRNGWIISRH